MLKEQTLVLFIIKILLTTLSKMLRSNVLFSQAARKQIQLKIPENWKIWKKTNKMSGCYLYTDFLLIGLTDLRNINSVVYFWLKLLFKFFFLNLTQSWKNKHGFGWSHPFSNISLPIFPSFAIWNVN